MFGFYLMEFKVNLHYVQRPWFLWFMPVFNVMLSAPAGLVSVTPRISGTKSEADPDFGMENTPLCPDYGIRF